MPDQPRNSNRSWLASKQSLAAIDTERHRWQPPSRHCGPVTTIWPCVAAGEPTSFRTTRKDGLQSSGLRSSAVNRLG